MPRRFLIDTDTASDDAVALLIALRHPDVEVEAITVVAGNVPLPQAVQNALYTVELAGADVPVYAGRDRPRAGALRTAQNVHGSDGMGDIGLPLSGRTPAAGDAVDILVERIGRSDGDLTLVTLGPLTNVAEAFERAPDLAQRLRSLVIMGGTSDGLGNVTPVAEFNVWVDPEAASIVFAAGAPVVMVGWDISRKYATFDESEAAWLRSLGPLGSFSVDIQATLLDFCLHETKLPGFDLPDPIATAIALDSTIATETVRRFVAVETRGEHTRGETVVDHLSVLGRDPNAEVVVEASRERFLALLERTLAR